ncbi:flagellar protein FlgN [Treponema zuelzerae]|uniref:Flagellar protein FlgN n=1 Tax=Teretinema zuelzerae TaxID=156 RepID=A0AAE3JJ74_9SPIR|nr:flagellar protein FlgN [Teretinema zuelzerae]
MSSTTLSQREIDERVAVLKRFRFLLEEKRRKFRDYLTVLEKQEFAIEAEDVDTLVSHTEIEQSIVSEIQTIQKVIEPMERMYREFHPSGSDSDIPVLATDLDSLQKKVLAQNEKNRDLLKSHMDTLRQKIISIKNPYAKRNSIYASDSHTAAHIDIKQ